jgi:hypothetical protein
MTRPGNRISPKRGAANEQLLQQAVSLHQQGHLDEAEALYRKILRSDPPIPSGGKRQIIC